MRATAVLGSTLLNIARMAASHSALLRSINIPFPFQSRVRMLSRSKERSNSQFV